MPRRRRHRPTRPPPGTPPGSLTPMPGAEPTTIDVMAWSPSGFEERRVPGAPEAFAYVGRFAVVWVNVTGFADAPVLEQLGRLFKLHRLALEDVVHTHQRPKVEAYDDRLFIVFRAPEPGAVPNGSGPPRTGSFATEQISLFLAPGFILTFQEGQGDCFEPVRERARRDHSRLRSLGPDSLAYALIDAAIDAFFPVAESLGERIEAIEECVLASRTRGVSAGIYAVRHDLMTMRRAVWPLRDMLSTLLRDHSGAFRPETRLYLRDCYDHSAQLMDLVETYRDLASGLMEVSLGMISLRMNEIMKVLTIIATVFMPLTFIVGLYGMNFDTAEPLNMPELHWRYGYLYALGLCVLCVAAMLWYFRRKGWIGGDDSFAHEKRKR